MSQSPNQYSTADAEGLSSYRNGWAALNHFIAEGRSFSGYERNGTFLNVQGGRFANIAATSGLDLMDDSRAMATCDWDSDGQPDLWITNRTAPRLRLMRNVSDQKAGGGSIGLRLKGVTCNRDAIGARVEVYVSGDPKPLIRTMSAGEGFLSQSSKWLHVGLGRANSIEQVTVRWPGGAAEDFQGVAVNGRYVLSQGSGAAQMSSIGKLTWPKEVVSQDRSSQNTAATRTWILGRVPMPESDYTKSNKPTLINLWSRTCGSCVAELAEWTEHETEIRKTGLDIVACSVDHLSGDASAGSDTYLNKIAFPFRSGIATQEMVDAMEIVHRSFVELQKPLPVPTSFLLDSKGRVAAIYKGRVRAEMLLEDVRLLDADLGVQRDAAVPYAGRWASNPFPPNPNRVATAFAKAGLDDQAIAYLKQFLARAREYLDGQFGDQKQSLQTVVVSHKSLGDLFVEKEDYQQAVRVYANLLKLDPQNAASHQQIGERLLMNNLALQALPHLLIAVRGFPDRPNLLFNTGLAALGSGQAMQAVPFFQKSLQIQPNDKATHYQLAVALELLGKHDEAVGHCRKALELAPDWALAKKKLESLLNRPRS